MLRGRRDIRSHSLWQGPGWDPLSGGLVWMGKPLTSVGRGPGAPKEGQGQALDFDLAEVSLQLHHVCAPEMGQGVLGWHLHSPAPLLAEEQEAAGLGLAGRGWQAG